MLAAFESSVLLDPTFLDRLLDRFLLVDEKKFMGLGERLGRGVVCMKVIDGRRDR
jgi:hypothetical protein